jgi:hypothetical protein
VSAVFNHFCQGQVVPEGTPGSRAHRQAEAGASRLSAIDGHHKNAFPGRFVVRVSVLPGGEDPVLDSYSVQLTGAHANEGVPGCFWRRLSNLEAVPGFLAPLQHQLGREQELSP